MFIQRKSIALKRIYSQGSWHRIAILECSPRSQKVDKFGTSAQKLPSHPKSFYTLFIRLYKKNQSPGLVRNFLLGVCVGGILPLQAVNYGIVSIEFHGRGAGQGLGDFWIQQMQDLCLYIFCHMPRMSLLAPRQGPSSACYLQWLGKAEEGEQMMGPLTLWENSIIEGNQFFPIICEIIVMLS